MIINKATGGIVKLDEVHRIGDDCHSHCLSFQDHRSIGIQPVMTDMTDEELREEIRKSLEIRIKIHKAEML